MKPQGFGRLDQWPVHLEAGDGRHAPPSTELAETLVYPGLPMTKAKGLTNQKRADGISIKTDVSDPMIGSLSTLAL
jgi:hypothetical protein